MSLWIYRDTLDLFLGLCRFRQSHGQKSIFEARGDFVLSHILNGNAPLEPAVVALAEQPVLVFSFSPLLAFDGKDTIGEFDLHILLFESGQFGNYLQFLA